MIPRLPSFMFLTLGLLVFSSRLIPILIPGILLSAFLIFVARSIAVFISLAFTRGMNARKKLFISWVGLRGAAPIVFTTFPLLAGINHAGTISNLVFSVTDHLCCVARLHTSHGSPVVACECAGKIKRKFPVDIELSDNRNSELGELDIPENSPVTRRAVVQIGLPNKAHIVLIHRNGKYISA